MNTTLAALERRAAATRTLGLMQAATATFADQPFMAAAWLHAPHPLLLGASPAAAAWFGGPLAHYAALLLAHDSFTVHVLGATDVTVLDKQP